MKIIFYLFCFFIPLSLGAQNLVPNPSFEDHVACPSALGQYPFASGAAISVSDWSKPTYASSDYLHVCYFGIGGFGLVPNNYAGYQTPRTGEAYAGIYCKSFSANDYKEYIQSHLSAPLIAGHRYRANYWVTLADWHLGISTQSTVTAVDQLGAYFGVLPEERQTYFWVLDDLIPQMKSPVGVVLTDTVNWMNVSGIFTAAGGEEWMILGNFMSQDSLNYVFFGGDSAIGQAYYYIDDVCVVDIDGIPATYHVIDTSLCNGQSVTLSPTLGTATNYFWDDGSTGTTRDVTQLGTYWVKYVKDGECTVYADTFKVNQVDTLDLNIGQDTVVCSNMPITLDAYKEGTTQYKWNTGSQEATLVVSAPGTYFVTISSSCFFGTDTIRLSPPESPKAVLPGDTTLCNGTEFLLQYQQLHVTNAWSTGDAGCCISVTDSGTYTLTTHNVCGETATDAITVAYTPCDDCIWAPTAFTPNGDGHNDVYEVRVRCNMSAYTLRIFNRWGKAIFTSHTPGETWDGKVNGKPADVGTYYYYVQAKRETGDTAEIEQKGDITLLR